MNILHEPLSKEVDLSKQWIERTQRESTVWDMVRKILDYRAGHLGNPKGKTLAERQSASVNLPLRILLRQQTIIAWDERASTLRFVEAIRALVGDIALLGFHEEEKVVAILEDAMRPIESEKTEERELLAA